MRVYLDLDEVLCQFCAPACELWGVTYEDALRHWPPGQWGMHGPLAAAVRESGQCFNPEVDGKGVTEDIFWRALTRNEEFWANLPVTPWAHHLVAEVAGLTCGDWKVVTTPSRCPSSFAGKKRWLDRFFGGHRSDLIFCYDKAELAGPGRVLVDDRDDNCEAFAREGGVAVTFPRHHNRHHLLKDDPLTPVLRALRYHASGVGEADTLLLKGVA